MTTLTADVAVSLDGYAAGPNQSADLPFGEGIDGLRSIRVGSVPPNTSCTLWCA
jgi:hypothetical protein